MMTAAASPRDRVKSAIGAGARTLSAIAETSGVPKALASQEVSSLKRTGEVVATVVGLELGPGEKMPVITIDPASVQVPAFITPRAPAPAVKPAPVITPPLPAKVTPSPLGEPEADEELEAEPATAQAKRIADGAIADAAGRKIDPASIEHMPAPFRDSEPAGLTPRSAAHRASKEERAAKKADRAAELTKLVESISTLLRDAGAAGRTRTQIRDFIGWSTDSATIEAALHLLRMGGHASGRPVEHPGRGKAAILWRWHTGAEREAALNERIDQALAVPESAMGNPITQPIAATNAPASHQTSNCTEIPNGSFDTPATVGGKESLPTGVDTAQSEPIGRSESALKKDEGQGDRITESDVGIVRREPREQSRQSPSRQEHGAKFAPSNGFTNPKPAAQAGPVPAADAPQEYPPTERRISESDAVETGQAASEATLERYELQRCSFAIDQDGVLAVIGKNEAIVLNPQAWVPLAKVLHALLPMFGGAA